MTTRRSFLKSSATAAGIATFAAPAVALNVRGANDRIRVGMVGLGGRMRSHIGSLTVLKPVGQRRDRRDLRLRSEQARRGGEDLSRSGRPEAQDLHRPAEAVRRSRSIDAVSFSTQDHWHALQTIWACQAGKDVYVEKPPTWCIWEGRQMVKAARKYGRMVQIGTQNRSSPNVREGMQKLKDGLIGELYMARGMTYKMRGNLGKHKPQPVPAGLNWDAWVGPAKMVEYSNFQHRRWYWICELRQRRRRQPDGPRHRQDPLGPGPGRSPDHGHVAWATASRPARTTTPTRPTRRRSCASGPATRCWSRSSSATGTRTRRPSMRDKYPFVAENQCVGEIFFGTQRLHDLPRLLQLLHVPRSEQRARPVQDRRPGPRRRLPPAN